MSVGLIIYLFIMIASGIALLFWSRLKLTILQRRKRRRIKNLDQIITVDTQSPIDDAEVQMKQDAVDNIKTRFSNLRKLSYYIIVFVWSIALILPFLTFVPAALLSVFVAAIGIILSVVARPFIENVISGVVISLAQPVRIGDTVKIDDHYSVVEDITMTHTILRVWDWKRYLIPNTQMLSKEIINYTMTDLFHWKTIKFTVSFESDVELVKKLAIEAAEKSKYFNHAEPANFWVMEMQENSYECLLAAWADTPSDAWELSNDVRISLIKSFQQHGIKTHRFEINH
jgi:small-conductance mechanosensitive channel